MAHIKSFLVRHKCKVACRHDIFVVTASLVFQKTSNLAAKYIWSHSVLAEHVHNVSMYFGFSHEMLYLALFWGQGQDAKIIERGGHCRMHDGPVH